MSLRILTLSIVTESASQDTSHTRLQSADSSYLPYCGLSSYDFLFMFEDFRATDQWSGQQVRCVYQALVVAIATRHADAIDIKFLVNDRPVWIVLPHPAWAEYNKRTGKIITDPLAVEIAGHYLKTMIENGEENGREMYTLTVDETLQYLDAVLSAAAALPR
jgi:hypothetical protein